jgi:hypothetical protein
MGSFCPSHVTSSVTCAGLLNTSYDYRPRAGVGEQVEFGRIPRGHMRLHGDTPAGWSVQGSGSHVHSLDDQNHNTSPASIERHLMAIEPMAGSWPLAGAAGGRTC